MDPRFLLLLAAATPAAAHPGVPSPCAPPPASAAAAGGGGLAVAEALTDLRREPLGVEDDAPAFSWTLTSSARDQRQSAWRILVATSRETLAQDVGDVWDSGKVRSDRSTGVRYGGPRLQGERRYWWKVRAWDEDDVAGPWGPDSSFSRAPDAWLASFVWDGSANPNDYCYLRKSFPLPSAPAEALVSVTAHDDYQLWVNGTLVGTGPAQSDPRVAALYDTYDVAPLLGPGLNLFAVRGHYHGLGVSCGVRAEPGFLLQARIRLADGTAGTVVSDGSWRVQDATPWDESSPVRGPFFAQATSAEWYDARLELDGWNTQDYDDSGWAAAQVVSPGYVLRSSRFPRVATVERLPAVSVAENRPGVLLVDFGENATGWPVLTVRDAAPGTEITVWYSEELDPTGLAIVRDRDGITNYHDRYTCRGGPAETWAPDVKYNGFRWIEIEGYPGTLDPGDVELAHSRAALDPVDDFRSSDALLDAMYGISVRTQLNAVQGVLVDCPQREQTQYLSDLVFQGLNLSHNVRDFGILRKPLDDFVLTALSGAVLLSRSPTEYWQVIPEWSLHMPTAVWLEYFLYDDPDVLALAYPTIEANLDLFDLYRDPVTNLLTDVPGSFSISDWPDSPLDTSCPALTPQNCLYHGALLTAADIAELLGETSDATRFRSIAAQVRDGINAVLFDGLDRYADCSGSPSYGQVPSVFALWFGVVPPGSQDAVLRYVEGLGFEAQVYGGWYLSELLFSRDRGELFLSLIDQTVSQWGRMLAEGSTTSWEGWEPTYSLSHAWSAYPMKFLKSGVLGVLPTSPGYATFRVRPQPGPLASAEGTVPTVKGDVFVRFGRTSSGLELEVRVPANTTAEVCVPAPVLSPEVLESGLPVWRAGAPLAPLPAGLTPSGEEPGYVRFTVGSGTWRFEARAPAPRPAGPSRRTGR